MLTAERKVGSGDSAKNIYIVTPNGKLGMKMVWMYNEHACNKSHDGRYQKHLLTLILA